jgi:serine/threonine protein kinase
MTAAIKVGCDAGMTGAGTALRPSRQTRHLAPELLNENSFGRPNLAIDVYALGFVALELLCGNKLASRVIATLNDPEQESENWLVWHASATEQLPPIAELFPDLPADLCALLGRMTCKQQHERFADARDCLESFAVEPVMERIPISVVPLPNANEGGVEIYGAPPHLHVAYNAPTGISWADVVRKPALLLTPEGRGHLTKVGLAALMLLASMFLLFQPEQASTQVTSVEEAADSTMSLDDYEPIQSSLANDNASNSGEAVAEEQPATVVAPLPKDNPTPRVTFEVMPQGKVLQVVGNLPCLRLVRMVVIAGAYTARCWSQQLNRNLNTVLWFPAEWITLISPYQHRPIQLNKIAP